MGSFSNDLKLTKTIKLGDTDKLDFTGGLFFNKQAVSLTWNFNQYLMQITGKNPALIATAATLAASSPLVVPTLASAVSARLTSTTRQCRPTPPWPTNRAR